MVSSHEKVFWYVSFLSILAGRERIFFMVKMDFGLKSSAFGKQFTRPVSQLGWWQEAARWMLDYRTMNLNRVCVSSETGFGAIIYLSSFITASATQNRRYSLCYKHEYIHKPTSALGKNQILRRKWLSLQDMHTFSKLSSKVSKTIWYLTIINPTPQKLSVLYTNPQF